PANLGKRARVRGIPSVRSGRSRGMDSPRSPQHALSRWERPLPSGRFGAVMTTSENPFRRAYWFGEVDPRPLALFRILFGSVVLFDSLRRLPDVVFFFSDDGHAPRPALPA